VAFFILSFFGEDSRFKVESTPKSKYYATKAQKHKIAPKHVVDFQSFVRFRDLVF
jgi:hypothetical protein